jgi:hypothetical protein
MSTQLPTYGMTQGRLHDVIAQDHVQVWLDQRALAWDRHPGSNHRHSGFLERRCYSDCASHLHAIVVGLGIDTPGGRRRR